MTAPYQRGERAYPMRHQAVVDDEGRSSGTINDQPKQGDYSGLGQAGGLRGPHGGVERDERDYRGGDARAYSGARGQSGAQAGGPEVLDRLLGRGPAGAQRADAQVRDDVREALARDQDVDDSTLEVQVIAGEVTLTGTVTAGPSRQRAPEVAAGVPGVREVHNQLRVTAS